MLQVRNEMTACTSKQLDFFALGNNDADDSWFSDALRALKIDIVGGWPDDFGNALHANLGGRAIRVLGLFAGAGGLDIGFHDAGFSIVECNELEPAFAATLQANTGKGQRLEGTKVVCCDIKDYQPSYDDIDFIIGGPPCQTFSAAGARAAGVNGTDDDRGNLFLQYARILKLLKPKGFLFENVYRIVGAQQGKAWARIQAEFKALGYTLHWRILDAADYGAPQFRERLFIVGLKTGSFQFPFPSHGPDSHDLRAYYTAGDAVKGLPLSTYPKVPGGRHGSLLKDIPPGLNYSFYTDKMRHPKPIFSWRSKFSDYLYKADPETPVRTIKAQGGQYTGPFSWENRPFSLPELKRLQTFPDDYDIIGNRQIAIHQIGNSVPPQLARMLALSIRQQVFSVRAPFRITLMPDSYQLGFRQRKAALTHVYAKKAQIAIARSKPSTPPIKLPSRVSYNFSIDPDLRLTAGLRSRKAEFKVSFRVLKGNNWRATLSDAHSKTQAIKYRITISPPSFMGQMNNCSTTSFLSTSSSHRSLCGLWRAFELFASQYLSKDDLIQLFGYYQYRNRFTIQMHLDNKPLKRNCFWNIVSLITAGQCVGSVMPIAELASQYDVSTDTLVPVFAELKSLGYEIRNHNTNKQIPQGSFLIPYSFPTLNERSLQRLTRL